MQFPYRLRKPRGLLLFLLALGVSACEPYEGASYGTESPRKTEERWAGEVVVHSENWTDRYSCSMDLEITTDFDSLSLDRMAFYCGFRSFRWSAAYHRRGRELWQDNVWVGTLESSGSVRVSLPNPAFFTDYPNPAQSLEITWTRSGEYLIFTLRENILSGARIFEAYLHRAN